MKKKKVLIAVIVVIGLVLLFPIPQRLKDGDEAPRKSC